MFGKTIYNTINAGVNEVEKVLDEIRENLDTENYECSIITPYEPIEVKVCAPNEDGVYPISVNGTEFTTQTTACTSIKFLMLKID